MPWPSEGGNGNRRVKRFKGDEMSVALVAAVGSGEGKAAREQLLVTLERRAPISYARANV